MLRQTFVNTIGDDDSDGELSQMLKGRLIVNTICGEDSDDTKDGDNPQCFNFWS